MGNHDVNDSNNISAAAANADPIEEESQVVPFFSQSPIEGRIMTHDLSAGLRTQCP